MSDQTIKKCPECKTNLEGDLIFKTFMAKYNNKAKALEVAKKYGATQRKGRWSRAIAIYDITQDRTCSHECPACQHRWPA